MLTNEASSIIPAVVVADDGRRNGDDVFLLPPPLLLIAREEGLLLEAMNDLKEQMEQETKDEPCRFPAAIALLSIVH
jgi:hypothetical protein